jgi:lipid-A-disaccharide synthase
MIIAGEASGDLHGASLIRELKTLDPTLEIFGIGGDKMIAEGMHNQYHIKQMAFLGFVEVIRHLPFIKRVQHDLLHKVEQEKITNIVLIDYPGFNLNIAEKLNRLGIKIFYFISPQVWAWGSGRIKKIKNLIAKMLVIFPFEEKIYKDAGVDANYIGHPLIEHVESYNFLPKDDFFEKLKLDKTKEILLLLPGSRKQEIKKIFPECISAALRIASDFNLQIVIACAENIDEKIFYDQTDVKDFKIVKGFTYDLFKYSKFGIIKSGTSTLEAGYFQLPFVVVYVTNYLTYFIAKRLAKISHIAMANILLGKTVIKELIQNDVNREKIYESCFQLLNDKNKYNSLKEELSSIKDKLGSAGASKRAAEIIFEAMNEA